jgi:hypothetical protein
MAQSEFVSVTKESEITYIKPAELADREVEGKFLGTFEGKFGPNHKIQTPTGTVVVNGCGSLNSRIQKVNEGEIIRLEYKGMKKIADGPMKGKSAHDVDVLRKKS